MSYSKRGDDVTSAASCNDIIFGGKGEDWINGKVVNDSYLQTLVMIYSVVVKVRICLMAILEMIDFLVILVWITLVFPMMKRQ